MKKNTVSFLLILSILISFICGALGGFVIMLNMPTGQSTIIKTSKVTLNEDNTISKGVEAIYDAVVVVEGFNNNQQSSTGTGFIYKEENGTSYIMTNHHVINGTNKVKVILSDETEIDADIKGSEAYSDIAVLAIPTNKAKHIAVLGNSEKLNVGDTVFTVGSPEGAEYAGSVTKGILSGKDRLVAVALSNSNTSDYYMKVLQTDAAINPGNSGGPLCNINGEVIGITNMKLVDSTVEGMGFAIPIEDALFYAATLEKGKQVVRPYFGIGMLDLTDSFTLWQNGININSKIKEGIIVTEVADNSPASAAKIKKGDIIISLGEEKISSIAEFRYQLYKHKVGEEVKVKLVRDNKEKTVTVKLTENKK